MYKAVVFVYGPAFSRTIVYMLQAVEYWPAAYLKWLWRVKDFSKVMRRKELVYTRPIKVLLVTYWTGYLAEFTGSAVLLFHGLANQSFIEVGLAICLFIFTPAIWAHLILLPLVLGNFFIIKPLHSSKTRESSAVLGNHSAIKIAIAGSYGKTTMKEILLTVLREGKNVAATPANKNVSISHAAFASGLKGDEDILIIEYGEGAPGDVAKFAEKTHPTAGIITGIAPAHLDRYKTLKQVGEDIFSLADYLGGKEIYVNGDSEDAREFIKKNHTVFSSRGIGGWTIKNVRNSLDGLSFTISKNGKILKIKSKLLGKHLVGPLALAAFLADKYGLSTKQIEDGMAKITPFEHRMQPYQLGGAWVIDDTYNGNIEGMKAGLGLLKELTAKRKIYVTPGLVDQGAEEKPVHIELGKTIKSVSPDVVVLMKNSVTDYIKEGMSGYTGELKTEDDPLDFYNNLDKFVAAGDLVLMQNDWPDNYN